MKAALGQRRPAKVLAALAFMSTVLLAGNQGAAAGTRSPDPLPLSDQVKTATIFGLEDGDSAIFSAKQAQLIVHAPSGPELSTDELSALAPTIVCSLGVHHPHPSGHVNGTINGTATISCSGVAGSLTLHYSLIRVSPNNTQWAATPKSNAGKRTIENNRGVPCGTGPGVFQGWAQGQITPPPGYVLSGPAVSSAYGVATNVACGGGARIAGGDSRVSERTTVTFVRTDLAE